VVGRRAARHGERPCKEGGREREVGIAGNLKNLGIPVEQIILATGLSPEEFVPF
jgi:hypothetical protein